ncbi:MAG: OsmC family protein [Bacillus sp. (in: Bacteria)]|nr:OsmC family protein [Bacillus sp. (in: firmicutes)]
MAVQTFRAMAQLKEGVQVIAKSRNFEVTIDEPTEMGGTNTGMNPVELLLCSLGACQAIVARVYAKKFEIQFDDLWIEVEGDIDLDGFLHKSDVRPGFSDIRYNVHIATEEPIEKVTEFVNFISATCPIEDTIAHLVHVSLNDIILEPIKRVLV